MGNCPLVFWIAAFFGVLELLDAGQVSKKVVSIDDGDAGV